MTIHRDPSPMAVRHEVEHRDHGGHHCLYLPALIAAFSAALFVLVVAVYVLWLAVSSTKATAFDSDGVRCYRAADAMTCIKTAEPER
jgi:hypothetical protein